jgi:hypothetical protein
MKNSIVERVCLLLPLTFSELAGIDFYGQLLGNIHVLEKFASELILFVRMEKC